MPSLKNWNPYRCKSLCTNNVDRMYRIHDLNEELSDLAEWIHAHELAIAKEEKKQCAS